MWGTVFFFSFISMHMLQHHGNNFNGQIFPETSSRFVTHSCRRTCCVLSRHVFFCALFLHGRQWVFRLPPDEVHFIWCLITPFLNKWGGVGAARLVHHAVLQRCLRASKANHLVEDPYLRWEANWNASALKGKRVTCEITAVNVLLGLAGENKLKDRHISWQDG